MRIAYFAGSLLPGQDGVTRVLYRMTTALTAAGVDHMFISPVLPPQEFRQVPMLVPRAAFHCTGTTGWHPLIHASSAVRYSRSGRTCSIFTVPAVSAMPRCTSAGVTGSRSWRHTTHTSQVTRSTTTSGSSNHSGGPTSGVCMVGARRCWSLRGRSWTSSVHTGSGSSGFSRTALTQGSSGRDSGQRPGRRSMEFLPDAICFCTQEGSSGRRTSAHLLARMAGCVRSGPTFYSCSPVMDPSVRNFNR